VCKDHLVTGESFELIRHHKYNALLTQPIPKKLEPYYEHPNYTSHQQKGTSLFFTLYKLLRHFNNQYKLSCINPFCVEKKKLLDFGAGTASFVEAAQKNGWNAKGYDPIVGQPQKKHNLYVATWAKDAHYQCITAWHVLEHLKQPQDFLSQAHKSLDENGILALALPNWASWDAAYYKSDWAAYDVPRHLWHFTPIGIKAMAKDSGFELIKQYPLRLDAYYVSMLSEKTQNNSFPWLRGAISGLRSNCKAIRTGMHSSLIYVFQKSK